MKKFIFIFICIGLFSCKEKNTKPEVKVDPQLTVPAPSQIKLDVGSIPEEEFMKMYNNASYVDYIFYNLPFSISQNDQSSVRSNLGMISSEPLTSLQEGCKPIGREFFQIDGVVAFEADLYYSEGCFGYVFMKDEKPIYANKMSEEGLKFYGNLIEQAKQIQQGNVGK